MTESESGVREETRERIWDDLRTVARPDSRFGWDFSSFIPDYEGSDACADRLLGQWGSDSDESWFVTPDNNLDPLRERLVDRSRPFTMPTYGIRRGFLRLEPGDVPEGQAPFASTLDGMNRFASVIELATMEATLPVVDCMVTGASLVTPDGLRMGKGHGFFDLEWAMLLEVGLVDEDTDVIAVVHDVQVLEDVAGQELAADHDTIVDAVVTPSRVIEIDGAPPKPSGIRWPLLDLETVQAMPPLETLWQRAGKPELGVGQS
jgi:5-formyltetrahydrofolate cyclo-ligase